MKPSQFVGGLPLGRMAVAGALALAVLLIFTARVEQFHSDTSSIQLAQFVPCPNGSCRVLAPDKEQP